MQLYEEELDRELAYAGPNDFDEVADEDYREVQILRKNFEAWLDNTSHHKQGDSDDNTIQD